MLRNFAFIGISTLILSVCGWMQNTSDAPKTLFPPVSEVESITISDEWRGLSPIAPLSANFYLNRSGDYFTGTADFSVGSYSTLHEAHESVAVPVDAVKLFWEILSDARLEPGTYTPKIEWTDDYPSINIRIRAGEQTLIIYSLSQGEGHVPWGATIGDQSYVIHSDAPMRALDMLRPFLKYDVQDTLIQQAQNP